MRGIENYETVDVVIIGAGISGVGAAAHMAKHFPERTYRIIDANPSHGGTWWTHKYPGVRTDSDMQTYGYAEHPWLGKTFATAQQIMDYMQGVMDECAITEKIRFNRTVTNARWFDDLNQWVLTIYNKETGGREYLRTPFLWNCAGYYSHTLPYRPHWPGEDEFAGQVFHSQLWPEDLDYTGKRVVVIGSGATAATVIPAFAESAAHVTMLQRSPTYFQSKPSIEPLKAMLDPLDIDPKVKHDILRKHFIRNIEIGVNMVHNENEALTQMFLDGMRQQLPEDFDMKHFTPRYPAWKQRVAAVPDGDMFAAVREGKVSVVTDTIECFTRDGIQVSSGEVVPADIVVVATGFNMNVLGEISFEVNGKKFDTRQHVTWRGVMIEGLPNMTYHFGYFRATWTLRIELVNQFVGRLWRFMDEHGHKKVCPVREDEGPQDNQPWVSSDYVDPGYMMRALPYLFQQGKGEAWRHFYEYKDEIKILPNVDLTEQHLRYA